MLRVLQIIEDGRFAGPQFRIVKLAPYLSKKFKYRLIIPRQSDRNFVARLDEQKVEFCTDNLNFLSSKGRNLFVYLILFFGQLRRLSKCINEFRPDIVPTAGGLWQLSVLFSCRYSNQCIILYLNDTSTNPIFKKIFHLYRSNVKGVIFASHASKAYYNDIIRDEIPSKIIPAPISTDYFIKKFFPASCGISLKVVTTCSISPVKGLEQGLQFLETLASLGYRVEWDIWGAVPVTQQNYVKNLNRLFKDTNAVAVNFRGMSADISGTLGNYHVYLCSSLAESSPQSVWEACLTGRFIISTDVGDVGLMLRNDNFTEIISDMTSGFSDGQAKSLRTKLSKYQDLQNLDRVCAERREQMKQLNVDQVALETSKFVDKVFRINK